MKLCYLKATPKVRNMNTLDHWIIGHSKTDKSPINYQYFYLEWLETKSPTKITFLERQPEDCNVIKIIQLRGGPKLTVCGKLLKQCETREPFHDLSEIAKSDNYCEYSNGQLLKSHLQKCIRRMDDTKSVLSAFHLMRLNFNDFARRFPIIAVEDANLHIGISVLIWFMCADPKRYLSQIHIRYFLGLVLNIATCPHYDRALTEDGKCKKLTEFSPSEFWEKCEKNISGDKLTILLSLMVRRCYGGMKGDMGMLAATCEKWYRMEIEDYMLSPCSQIKIRNYLALHHFVLAGIDFHCFPNILNKIHEKHPEISTSDIKKCLWLLSSSINYRLPKTNYPKEVTDLYQRIKKDYHQIAKTLLRNCH